MIGRIYEILSSGYPIKSGQTLLFYINKKISKKSRWNILFFMPEGELKQVLFTKILKFTHEKK
jgi:cell division inhibitor SulA